MTAAHGIQQQQTGVMHIEGLQQPCQLSSHRYFSFSLHCYVIQVGSLASNASGDRQTTQQQLSPL